MIDRVDALDTQRVRRATGDQRRATVVDLLAQVERPDPVTVGDGDGDRIRPFTHHDRVRADVDGTGSRRTGLGDRAAGTDREITGGDGLAGREGQRERVETGDLAGCLIAVGVRARDLDRVLGGCGDAPGGIVDHLRHLELVGGEDVGHRHPDRALVRRGDRHRLIRCDDRGLRACVVRLGDRALGPDRQAGERRTERVRRRQDDVLGEPGHRPAVEDTGHVDRERGAVRNHPRSPVVDRLGHREHSGVEGVGDGDVDRNRADADEHHRLIRVVGDAGGTLALGLGDDAGRTDREPRHQARVADTDAELDDVVEHRPAAERALDPRGEAGVGRKGGPLHLLEDPQHRLFVGVGDRHRDRFGRLGDGDRVVGIERHLGGAAIVGLHERALGADR